MNQISPRSMGASPLIPALPETSPWLTAVLHHATASGALPPLVMPAGVGVAVSGEARSLLPAMRRRAMSASADAWDDFLRPLVAATRNPPTQSDFLAFVAAAAVALDGIPARLLTDQRRAAAVRRFDFWPSVADLANWLEPEAREERAALLAMERLAVAKPEAAVAPEPRTPEMVAAVADKLRALKAEIHAQDEAARPVRERVAPRHLTPHEEIAVLEAQIADGQDRSGSLAHLLRVQRAWLEGGAA
jgi:hypothetical protein